jgi:hypothetical protein
MGKRVKRIRTNVSELDMANAIKQAWVDLFGKEPFKEQVAMLMAQNSLETGNRKSMWNYNVGNITTGGNSKYNFFDDLTTDEQIKPGKWEKRNLKYRSYDSLKEGVKDYIRLISGGRYAKAWQSVVNPDPVAFSKALKQSGYYTANEAPYTKGLTALFKQYVSKSNYSTQKGTSPPIAANTNNKKPFDLNQKLNELLKMVAEENMKTYIIKINSANQNDSIEFGRILAMAVSEELGVSTSIHNKDTIVDVEFSFDLDKKDVIKAVQQFTSVLADIFATNTQKIKTSKLETQVFNKKSNLELINIKKAELNHRSFLLRFARVL